MKVSKTIAFDADLLVQVEKLAPDGNISSYVQEAVEDRVKRDLRKHKE